MIKQDAQRIARLTITVVSLAFTFASSRMLAQQAPVTASTDVTVKVEDPKTRALNAAPQHPREHTLIKRRWGIELMGVQLTSGDYMLEFRYKVLDAKKAKPIFERKS